jgi:uncharacterized membrane protein YtjA (UPF0391 family)
MLRAALAFLVLAILAAFFGLGSIAGLSMDIAVILFLVALVLIVVGVLFGGRRLRI